MSSKEFDVGSKIKDTKRGILEKLSRIVDKKRKGSGKSQEEGPTQNKEQDNLSPTIPEPPPIKKRERLEPILKKIKSGPAFIALALGAILLALFIIGLIPRLHNQGILKKYVAIANEIPVSVISPKLAPPITDLRLPGTARGYFETPIWARVNGYIKNWWVDIGDEVKEGQLMAVIDAPDIDRQVLEMEGVLKSAEANLEIARISLDRWKELIKTRAVSQQQLDERQAAYDAALARVNASRGQYEHWKELQNFEKIYAPFSGVVTARNIDIGTLVSLGSDKGVRELYRISVTDVMRVYVAVPQNYAPQIQLGAWADVTASELPGKIFKGLVVRTSKAVDPLSRTLLTEVDVGNPNGEIIVNMYVDVTFHLPRTQETYLVPVNTIVVRADGNYVLSVDEHQTVHYNKVELGKDLGQFIEIPSGLSKDQKIILNPPEILEEGDKVVVVDDLSKPKPDKIKEKKLLQKGKLAHE
ncbi:membrane protein [Methylacidiphilum kamchatkense Kam1]|uniref:Membrane protein n=1 Tax=Methylacidiphilum kamchatkense Kam1 TaxID=1202785 RepID=A0A0C1URR9_9BACT|nr:efflux RND transporter periplasmic adaptor subunit [Methylacidiphilum kamchatkense]KIE58989.1 membrane protein [Methylacidiphilum kamchatkense Kam1]QDQ43122.1 RND family efflux transporter MFP subunit [Methylacidiphilum kamchatkense Kam1]